MKSQSSPKKVPSQATLDALARGRETRRQNLLKAGAADAGSNRAPDPEATVEASPQPQPPRGPAKKATQRKQKGRKAPFPDASPDKKEDRNKTAEARRQKRIIEMARNLKGGHELASMFTGLQSFLITDDQAMLLADPALAVCQKYGISVEMVLGPEVQLLTVCAMIYGPMARRLQAEVEAKRQEGLRSAHPNAPPPPRPGAEVIRPAAWQPPPQSPSPSPVVPPTEDNPIAFDVPAGTDEGGAGSLEAL